MHFVFYRTSDVFAAEEALQEKGINTTIDPTPVQDKAYCGVCVNVAEEDVENARVVLEGFEYTLV